MEITRFSLRKVLLLTLIMMLTLIPLFQNSVKATGSNTSTLQKEKPFPSQNQNNRMSIASLQSGNIGNDFIQAQVGSDGRFNAGLKALNSEDHWYNIIYSWPYGPGTSFTTLKVDGEDKVYGNVPEGEFIQSPSNDDSNSKNESVWKTGDVSVKQVLQAGVNPATGQPDALQIRYTITNTGTINHDVGLRMMLDTMVDGNDSAPFKIPGANGVESIDYEKDYNGDEVPDFWQVFNNFENPEISAQYSMSGGNATAPDRFAIINWGSITDTKWDYEVTPNRGTGDSAVGMWWNPVNLSPGETKTIVTYYGRPGVGGESALVLSGKKTLTHEEWSSSPTNLIAYFTNNTGENKGSVRLELESSPGISLVDNDAVHELGQMNSGQTTQSTWRLQPNTHGTHQITVKAYEEGSSEAFATSTYKIEALEPVIPPNITIGGNSGTAPDGRPVAGRMSPLTINASFDNPQAVGVTLIAEDATGDRYETHMDSVNSVDWNHTFIPSDKGLWDAPLKITVIPRYEDGTTGAEQSFEIVLIDPSGFIYHEGKGEDWRLPGATVVLQYFDPLFETWVTMTDEAYPGMLLPTTNPQLTGEDGRYAWDVAEGKYRVIVSRQGFETTISREVDVPPPVLDLDVALTPTDAVTPRIMHSGVQNNQSYTDPVTIEFSAADDEAGIRYVAYKVDGNEEVKINGNNGSLLIEDIGQHSVVLQAVDHAGNVKEQVINFEIKAEEPAENILDVITAAIEKSKEAKVEMDAAMSKINKNASKQDIEEHLIKAKAASSIADEKIKKLKELFTAYESPTLPASLRDYMNNHITNAEIQNGATMKKLDKAVEFLLSDESYTRTKSRLKEAQAANKLSTASLEFVKGNLIIFSP
jgi:hypothetical protein